MSTRDPQRLPRASVHVHTVHLTAVQAQILQSVLPMGSHSCPVASMRACNAWRYRSSDELARPSLSGCNRNGQSVARQVCASQSRKRNEPPAARQRIRQAQQKAFARVRSRRGRDSPGSCPTRISATAREVILDVRHAHPVLDFAGSGLPRAVSAVGGYNHSLGVAE